MNKFNRYLSTHDEVLLISGICPLLVIITNAIIGFSIGIICLITIVLTCTIISLLKNLIPLELRLPVIIIISSTVISLFSLALQYWFYPLSEAAGIYISLIAVNCIILGFAEEISYRNTALNSFTHSLCIGTGILLLLLLIGILRETLGFGTLFQQAELLLGDNAGSWTIQLIEGFSFILVKQTPGAFLVLGLLIAGINYIINKNEQAGSS